MMRKTELPDDCREELQANVKRAVGISALKKILSLCRSFEEEEHWKNVGALWVLLGSLVAALIFIALAGVSHFRRLAAIGFAEDRLGALGLALGAAVIFLCVSIGYLMRRIDKVRRTPRTD